MKYDIVLKRRNAQDNGFEEVTISAKDFAAGNFAALNPPEPKDAPEAHPVKVEVADARPIKEPFRADEPILPAKSHGKK